MNHFQWAGRGWHNHCFSLNHPANQLHFPSHSLYYLYTLALMTTIISWTKIFPPWFCRFKRLCYQKVLCPQTEMFCSSKKFQWLLLKYLLVMFEALCISMKKLFYFSRPQFSYLQSDINTSFPSNPATILLRRINGKPWGSVLPLKFLRNRSVNTCFKK